MTSRSSSFAIVGLLFSSLAGCAQHADSEEESADKLTDAPNVLAPNRDSSHARFGSAIATTASLAVVGSPYADMVNGGESTGCAFVFERQGGRFGAPISLCEIVAKARPDDRLSGSRFGDVVAAMGDTIIVGASSHVGTGATLYVFKKAGVEYTLTQVQELGGAFQLSLGLTPSHVIIGQPKYADHGRVRIFERDGNGGIVAESAKDLPASCGTNFGSALASIEIGDSEILAASESTATACEGQPGGRIRMFSIRSGSRDWSEAAALTVPGAGERWVFGASLVFAGDSLAVGSPWASVNGGPVGDGAVHVFRREGSGWRAPEVLLPSRNADTGSDCFGRALAGKDGVLFVGSPTCGDFERNGLVYRFENKEGAWKVVDSATIEGKEASGLLGSSLAISNDELLAGAASEDRHNVTNAGAVYRLSL